MTVVVGVIFAKTFETVTTNGKKNKMRTTRYNFNEVSVKAIKRWIGPDGKKKQKTQKFYQTINPWNKNPDGSVKTREQIMAEIKIERDNWIELEPQQIM